MSYEKYLIAASVAAVWAVAGCAVNVDETVDVSEQPTIFGGDSRHDFGDMSRYDQRLARSVAAQFWDVPCSGATCTLPTAPWVEAPVWDDHDWDPETDRVERLAHLCPDVRFYGQQSGAACTGMLVAPDTILTARHCKPQGSKFVFGFFADADGGNEVTEVPALDVYECVSAHIGSDSGSDWALCKLDRPVRNRPVLPVRYTTPPEQDSQLVNLAHHTGLPLKSGVGWQMGIFNAQRFMHNVDSMGGASGSPLFQHGRVVGMHVVGFSEAFVRRFGGSTCAEYATCDLYGCGGHPEGFHKAQRIDPMGHHIPLFPAGIVTVL